MLLIALAACGMTAPSAQLQGVEVTAIAWEQVDVDLSVRVHNPLPLDVAVTGGSWQLDVAGHRMSSGALDRSVVVVAGSDTVVTVPVVVHLDDLPSSAELSGDTVACAVRGELVVATPFGDRGLPFSWAGEVPRPRMPEWELVDWTAEIDGAAVVVTPMLRVAWPEGWRPGQLEWKLRHGERTVVGGVIAPPDGDRLSVPARVDVREVGGAAMELVRGGGRQWDLHVLGTLTSPLGELPLEVTAPIVGAPSAAPTD